MRFDEIKKITYILNTVILGLVLGLMAFFHICGATILFYFSIPTIMIYLLGYYLIYKDNLFEYTRVVYLWLTIYMSLTTVCLGTEYGFSLYCLSMIPLIFIVDYMAYSMGMRRFQPMFVSVMVALCYAVSTGYVRHVGPVYNADILKEVFWHLNSFSVISLIIFYTSFIIKNIILSEERLKKNAHEDKLTGLFNRHYMLDMIERASADEPVQYLAMADIDDFKMINDRYGHNAGDYILVEVARVMRSSCGDCTISRWGGEEFLILGQGDDASSKMETLRKNVEENEFIFEGQKIDVTLTIGLSYEQSGRSVDKWVMEADERLYEGKKSGKNRVVG